MRLDRNSSISHQLFDVSMRGVDKMLDLVKVVLPSLIFTLKFLQWWSSESELSNLHTPTVPPPILSAHVSDKYKRLSLAWSGKNNEKMMACVICRKPIKNAAALTSSGYIYCYICIYDFVRTHHQCPITNLPTCVSQIRKVYMPTR